MKTTRILMVLAVIGGIALAVWVWQTAVQKRQNSENHPRVSIEDQTQSASGPTKEVSLKPPKKEERFSMIYRPSIGSDTIGSITLKNTGTGYTLISTERPGDTMMMTLDAMSGGMQTIIGTGDGSEIRFIGTFKTDQGVVTGEKNSRLSFRKADGDWAYVSGLGQYEEQGKVTKLGYNRTVESCLDLLKSEDPILREGGARDLGRLCTVKDARRVVPQLAVMLKDSSVPTRRGAIEGLGLIGTDDATTVLQAAYAGETDKITKEYFEESLGFCAAYSILGESSASVKPPDAGLDRLLGKADKGKKSSSDSKKKWVIDNLIRRVAEHQQEALMALDKATASKNPKIVAVAALIKKAIQPSAKEKKP